MRGAPLALAVAAPAIAAATAALRASGANPTTVGFGFLIVVLLLAAWRGPAAGLAGALLATACYNFFFLPPVGTFTIADPANWVALAAFLGAVTIASRLMLNARREAAEADARRRELVSLYELCVALFASTNRFAALADPAAHALRILRARGGGLGLLQEGSDRLRIVYSQGEPPLDGDESLLKTAAREGQRIELPAPEGSTDVYLPLRVGREVIGVLVGRGADASGAALASVAQLVALAVERERNLADQAHLEGLRQSDAMKTSLLRAVSHDLRSPLTAIGLQVEGLSRLLAGDEAGEARRSLDALRRESARLARRIDNLLAAARLEAGMLKPRPEPVPAVDLINPAREALPALLEDRPLVIRIAPDCPDVRIDPALAVEILVNLVENAVRHSPPEKAVELGAAPHPVDRGRVRIEIRDAGPGFPAAYLGELTGDPAPERTRGETGDSGRRGLGLEIARHLAQACGATLTLHNHPGGGALARLDLPAAPGAEEADGAS